MGGGVDVPIETDAPSDARWLNMINYEECGPTIEFTDISGIKSSSNRGVKSSYPWLPLMAVAWTAGNFLA